MKQITYFYLKKDKLEEKIVVDYLKEIKSVEDYTDDELKSLMRFYVNQRNYSQVETPREIINEVFKRKIVINNLLN